jgi:hypothetical protein
MSARPEETARRSGRRWGGWPVGDRRWQVAFGCLAAAVLPWPRKVVEKRKKKGIVE